jgi:predicted AAA+ superfamily ATPase
LRVETSETNETRYFDRLIQAYPIHPEVFDRLYEDWTTLDSFQRTRGVLKLMARVIFRLWKDQNQDYMIMPGSLPLYDSGSRNELVYYLPPGWDAVIETDIDGRRSEASDLDQHEPRFGSLHAARRVARTVFLGSAPSSSGAIKRPSRGIDRGRILLGCVQPGKPSSSFSDALDHLSDCLHYLNSTGDRTQDSTRYWFDTRANLRREMEDRKGRFNDRREVCPRIEEALRTLTSGCQLFDGVHVFTQHGDIPDDGAVRLVLLHPDKTYSKRDEKRAFEEVMDYIRSNGVKPRYHGNQLVFVVGDDSSISWVKECARTTLAWASIVEDIKAGRLNIDRLQEEQAKKELEITGKVLLSVARECYKWAISPVMPSPGKRDIRNDVFPIAITGTYLTELERVCNESEFVISTWAPLHLRTKLYELYWKDGVEAIPALQVWEDTQKYLYMPRLRRRSVFEQVIRDGAACTEYFGTATGKVGDEYEGFKFADGTVLMDETLLLIEPAAAAAYAAKLDERERAAKKLGDGQYVDSADGALHGAGESGGQKRATGVVPPPRAKSCFGSIEVGASAAKMKLVDIADEVIAQLALDPHAVVRVTVEISAEFSGGVSDSTKRAVTENAKTLGFKSTEWE